MAKAAPEITGFHVGGIIPLDMVGYVMRDIITRGGALETIQPFAETRKPANGHALPTNGVAGLLPAPNSIASSLSGKALKKYTALVDVLQTAGPSGFKIRELTSLLKKKNVSEYIIRSLLKKMKASGEAKESPSTYWHPGAAPATVANTSPSGKAYDSKSQKMIDFIASRGEAGASRKDIMAALHDAGEKAKYWSKPHIDRLLKDGIIKRPARDLYVSSSVNGGSPAAKESSDANDTRFVVASLLRREGATARHIVASHIAAKKHITKASARQTLRRMVKDKEIIESATGMISLP